MILFDVGSISKKSYLLSSLVRKEPNCCCLDGNNEDMNV